MLTTPRLILRDFRESDFAACCEIDTDAESVRYERAVAGEEVTRARFQLILADLAASPRTHFRWAITLPSDDRLRGWIALTLNNANLREYEIGWTVIRQDWGIGYATEAAAEVLRFAFEQLQAHRVVAFCHIDNRASSRVMEKLGMQREGRLRETRWLNDAWHDELVYSILEREFLVLYGE